MCMFIIITSLHFSEQYVQFLVLSQRGVVLTHLIHKIWLLVSFQCFHFLSQANLMALKSSSHLLFYPKQPYTSANQIGKGCLSRDLWAIVLLCRQWLLHISLLISYMNLVFNQENNIHLLSLSILITHLLENVWIV